MSEVEEPSNTSKNPAPLGSISSLAKLLPSGTVMAFNALIPSFSNNGTCVPADRYLTATLILSCSLASFFSVFTDSFVKDNKIYYGIATLNGLYVFNDHHDHNRIEDVNLRVFRISFLDCVHALGSLMVFLVFAFSDTIVQDCFFPKAGINGRELIRNLPLGASVVSSFLFMLFPTKRRGIGYSDMAPTTFTSTATTARTTTTVPDGHGVESEMSMTPVPVADDTAASR